MKIIIKKNKNNKSGFTLIELIIVVGIIAVISALTLFNSSGLNSSVLLSNTAYEVGLIIRDAQVAGLGAKVLVDSGGNATTSNQGVYFDIREPNRVIFFADLNRDDKYSGITEDSQVYNIENNRAGKILNICIISGTTCTDVENLNVIFKRPNPEAYFYYEVSGVSGNVHQGNIAINMGFPSGECRSIIIYKTGAIQIDKNYCPLIAS